jgi:CRP-like cAMP-binding protein
MASKDPKVDMIKSVSMFSELGRRELEEIAQLVDEVDVPAGRVLMRQGDVGNEMFVVVSGKFRIERNGALLRELGPGAVIGEVALLSEGVRTATITAAEPSQILVAGHREFHRLLQDHPSIQMEIINSLAEKIRVLDQESVH